LFCVLLRSQLDDKQEPLLDFRDMRANVVGQNWQKLIAEVVEGEEPEKLFEK